MEKNLGKIVPPGGSDPLHFWKSGCIPSMVMCPAHFHPDISKTVACKRLRAFEKRNSSNFEAMPPSPGGSDTKKIFFSYFSWVRAMPPSNFQIEISRKMLGKIFPPGGSDPHNFWNSDCVPHRVMCLQNFIQISLKLWPVDVCEI